MLKITASTWSEFISEITYYQNIRYINVEGGIHLHRVISVCMNDDSLSEGKTIIVLNSHIEALQYAGMFNDAGWYCAPMRDQYGSIIDVVLGGFLLGRLPILFADKEALHGISFAWINNIILACSIEHADDETILNLTDGALTRCNGKPTQVSIFNIEIVTGY